MDEIIAIVDDNNKIIGKKQRKNLTDNDCWRVSCIWVEDGKGNVLIQKRQSNLATDPNLWSCAAVGTVTDEDSYEATARREAFEEIGLADIPLKPAGLIHTRASFGWRWYKGFTAICDWPIERFTPQTEEVAELAWVDKATMLQEIQNKDPKYTSGSIHYPELFNID